MRGRLDSSIRFPEMKLLVDFNDLGFGRIDEWENITDYVLDISGSREKESEVLGGVSSDIFTFTIDNTNNVFSNHNTRSPYHGKVRGNVRFVLKTGFEGEELDISAIGYVRGFEPKWRSKELLMKASCPMDKLKKKKPPQTKYQDITLENLITILLAEAGIDDFFERDIPKTEYYFKYFKFEEDSCFNALKSLMQMSAGQAYFEGDSFKVHTKLALDYVFDDEEKHNISTDDAFEFDEVVNEEQIINKVEIISEHKEILEKEVVWETPENLVKVENELVTYEEGEYIYINRNNLPLYWEEGSEEIELRNMTTGVPLDWEVYNAELGRIKLTEGSLREVYEGDTISVSYTYQSLVIMPDDQRRYVAEISEEVFSFLTPDVSAWSADGTKPIRFSLEPDVDGTVSLQRFSADDDGSKVEIILKNNTDDKVSISTLQLRGYPIRTINPIEVHNKHNPSIEKFDEHKIEINNNYINNSKLAQKLSQYIIDNFSNHRKNLNINISGYPELKLNDIAKVTDSNSGTNHKFTIERIDYTFNQSNGWTATLDLLEADKEPWVFESFDGESFEKTYPGTPTQDFVEDINANVISNGGAELWSGAYDAEDIGALDHKHMVPDFWYFVRETGNASARVRVGGNYIIHGKQSFEITSTDSGTGYFYQIVKGVKTSTEYTISLESRMIECRGELVVEEYNEKDELVESHNLQMSQNKEYDMQFITTEETTNIIVKIRKCAGNYTSETFWFDKVKVEVGDTPTPYIESEETESVKLNTPYANSVTLGNEYGISVYDEEDNPRVVMGQYRPKEYGLQVYSGALEVLGGLKRDHIEDALVDEWDSKASEEDLEKVKEYTDSLLEEDNFSNTTLQHGDNKVDSGVMTPSYWSFDGRHIDYWENALDDGVSNKNLLRDSRVRVGLSPNNPDHPFDLKIIDNEPESYTRISPIDNGIVSIKSYIHDDITEEFIDGDNYALSIFIRTSNDTEVSLSMIYEKENNIRHTSKAMVKSSDGWMRLFVPAKGVSDYENVSIVLESKNPVEYIDLKKWKLENSKKTSTYFLSPHNTMEVPVITNWSPTPEDEWGEGSLRITPIKNPKLVKYHKNLLTSQGEVFHWNSPYFEETFIKENHGIKLYEGFRELQDKKLTLSFEARTKDLEYGETNPFLGIEFEIYYSDETKEVFELGGQIVEEKNQDWTLYSSTFKVSDKEISDFIGLKILMRDATGAVWIRNIQLEFGSEVTPFEPYHELSLEVNNSFYGNEIARDKLAINSDNEPIKKKIWEHVHSPELNWFISPSDYDGFVVAFSEDDFITVEGLDIENYVYVTKNDGKLLPPVDGVWDSADCYYVGLGDTPEKYRLAISISEEELSGYELTDEGINEYFRDNPYAILYKLPDYKKEEVDYEGDLSLEQGINNIHVFSDTIDIRESNLMYANNTGTALQLSIHDERRVKKYAQRYADSVKFLLKEDIDSATDQIEETRRYIDEAFRDGIISDTERQILEQVINDLQGEKITMDSRYETIISNPFLRGIARSELEYAKMRYDMTYTDLINAIDDAIRDGEITEEEREMVNDAFSEHLIALGELSEAFDNAIDVIAELHSEQAKDEAIDHADRIDEAMRDDLNLEAPLPSSIVLNSSGITALTERSDSYARMDYRGLYVRGGAIQIDGGLPDDQIKNSGKWNTQGTYINKDGVYTGEVVANQIHGGTLKAINNNTSWNLNTGNLRMEKTDFTLGGGADIEFKDFGNRLYYSLYDPAVGFSRTSGFGVGRSINDTYPYAFLGAVGTGRSNFNPKDDAFFSGFIANTRIRTAEDGIGNSVVGNVFHIRDLAVSFKKGFKFDLTGSRIVMHGINSGTYNYDIGSSLNRIDRLWVNSLRVPKDFVIRNSGQTDKGWRLQTNYAGDGTAISFYPLYTNRYNYSIGRSNNRLTSIFVKNVRTNRVIQKSTEEDKQLIDDIDLEMAYDLIKSLEPKSYFYDDDEVLSTDPNDPDYYKGRKVGFMLEDVQSLDTNYKYYLMDQEETGLDNQNFITLLWQASRQIINTLGLSPNSLRFGGDAVFEGSIEAHQLFIDNPNIEQDGNVGLMMQTAIWNDDLERPYIHTGYVSFDSSEGGLEIRGFDLDGKERRLDGVDMHTRLFKVNAEGGTYFHFSEGEFYMEDMSDRPATRRGFILKRIEPDSYDGREHIISDYNGTFTIYPDRRDDSEWRFRIRSHNFRSNFKDDFWIDEYGDSHFGGFNITHGSVWVGDELVIGNNDPDKHRYVARYLPSSGTLEVASMDSNGDWWKRMEMRGRGKGSRIEFFNDLYNVSVYESSNSNAPNVRVGASGKFYRTTSSKRYKEDIQLADVDSGKILNLEPKSWYDKGEVERNNGSTEGLRRVYGLIAEDVEDAGLEEYVEYGEDGKVEGLKYERLLTLLIPETKKIRDENIRLQEEVGELKDKIKEIKENLMGGM